MTNWKRLDDPKNKDEVEKVKDRKIVIDLWLKREALGSHVRITDCFWCNDSKRWFGGAFGMLSEDEKEAQYVTQYCLIETPGDR